MSDNALDLLTERAPMSVAELAARAQGDLDELARRGFSLVRFAHSILAFVGEQAPSENDPFTDEQGTRARAGTHPCAGLEVVVAPRAADPTPAETSLGRARPAGDIDETA